MEELLQAAGRFAATLKDKGYTGSFLTGAGYPDDPEKSLSGFIRDATVADIKKIREGFHMETYLSWNGEQQERICATFRAAYRNGAFEVSQMDIEYKNRYGMTIKNCRLDGLSTARLPERSAAIAKVKAVEKEQQATGRSRFRGLRFVLAFWLLSMLPCTGLYAQSTWFKEWFRQKKTQKEYLMLQIVALKAYAEIAWKGYKIADKGLTVIGNIKDGEFNLHRDFFGSLEAVSPSVRNYTKVADIIAMQAEIITGYRKDVKVLQGSGMFSPEELRYITDVYGRLLEGCTEVVDELTMLTTNSSLKMTDDERLQRIEKLYEEMRDNRAFLGLFGGQAKTLAANRQQELIETASLKEWNGIE